MSLSYSTVACNEVWGTAEESYSIEGGIQCSVTLEVDSANKNALIQDLLLNQNVWPQLSGLTKPPRAFSAVAKPFSTESPVDGQTYVWDVYRVTVQYSTSPKRTLVSEELEPNAEFIKLDNRYFRWASGAPLTDAEAPGLLRKSLSLVRTYYQATAVPAAVLSGVGQVHNSSYVSSTLGLTFAAETLLFLPNPVQTTVTTDGSDGFNYAIKFAYNPQGWNKFYRPSTNSYESIYDLSGSVIKPYPPADLSTLLA